MLGRPGARCAGPAAASAWGALASGWRRHGGGHRCPVGVCWLVRDDGVEGGGVAHRAQQPRAHLGPADQQSWPVRHGRNVRDHQVAALVSACAAADWAPSLGVIGAGTRAETARRDFAWFCVDAVRTSPGAPWHADQARTVLTGPGRVRRPARIRRVVPGRIVRCRFTACRPVSGGWAAARVLPWRGDGESRFRTVRHNRRVGGPGVGLGEASVPAPAESAAGLTEENVHCPE